ncbi:phage tail protein [Enterobacter sp. Z1]|nr:phage tail protein [Enterobacter sp. Z1]
MLGDFAFSIDTTAYNQLTREASWRWSEQERIGKQDLLQYTGKPGRTVRLEGSRMRSFVRGWMPLTISTISPIRISRSSWSAVKGMCWAGGW